LAHAHVINTATYKGANAHEKYQLYETFAIEQLKFLTKDFEPSIDRPSFTKKTTFTI